MYFLQYLSFHQKILYKISCKILYKIVGLLANKTRGRHQREQIHEKAAEKYLPNESHFFKNLALKSTTEVTVGFQLGRTAIM